MLTQPHILIFGHDLSLLETRGWMLAKAGFSVERAASLPELERLLPKYRPELIVLCHSLSAEECMQAEQMAQKGRSSPQILLLHPSVTSQQQHAATSLQKISSDPLHLITTVQRLTRRNNSHPKPAQSN